MEHPLGKWSIWNLLHFFFAPRPFPPCSATTLIAITFFSASSLVFTRIWFTGFALFGAGRAGVTILADTSERCVGEFAFSKNARFYFAKGECAKWP